jgi:hypothetical protein
MGPVKLLDGANVMKRLNDSVICAFFVAMGVTFVINAGKFCVHFSNQSGMADMRTWNKTAGGHVLLSVSVILLTLLAVEDLDERFSDSEKDNIKSLEPRLSLKSLDPCLADFFQVHLAVRKKEAHDATKGSWLSRVLMRVFCWPWSAGSFTIPFRQDNTKYGSCAWLKCPNKVETDHRHLCTQHRCEQLLV